MDEVQVLTNRIEVLERTAMNQGKQILRLAEALELLGKEIEVMFNILHRLLDKMGMPQ